MKPNDILAIEKNRIELANILDADADREIAADELPAFQADPFSLITSGKLQIRTKEGERIKWQLNTCQRKVFDKILELRKQGRPVRIWILKFRQGGVSTLCEGVFYALTSLLCNRNALVMADEQPKTAYLHEIAKFFHDWMRVTDPAITPKIKLSNERKLEYEGMYSQFIISTAENIDAPRARTYQYVLLSECARYRNLPAILQSMQGIPDHADTIVIGETTANGSGTPFEAEWLAAKRGTSDWVALFLGWYMQDEYRRPLPWYPIGDIEYDREGGSLEAFLREEREIKDRYELDDEQLNWRRWAIVNKCKRTVKTFRVEYPADDEEAFQTSGVLFYPAEHTRKQCEEKPLAVGYFVPSAPLPEFRDSLEGPVRIYQWPGPSTDRHVLAADPSEGVGGDEAAAVVRCTRDNHNVAEIYGDISPDSLAAQLFLLSQVYPGIIVPERNGVGAALVQALLRLTGNIYSEVVNETGGKTSKRVGWWTSDVSRPLMFDQLGQELRDHSVRLSGWKSIQEVKQLVSDGGKPVAPPMGQDGLAICNAIASYVRRSRHPGLVPTREQRVLYRPPPPRNMGMSFATK